MYHTVLKFSVSQTKKHSQFLLLTTNLFCLFLLFTRALTSSRFKGFSLEWVVKFLSYSEKRKINRNNDSLSFVVTRCLSLSLIVPLIFTRCTTLYHSLSFVVTRFTTHCHSMYIYRVTKSNNEWQRVVQRVQRVTTNDVRTSSDNEWKKVTTFVTTSDNEWQRMTTSGTTNNNEWYNERQRVNQRVITNDNKCQRLTQCHILVRVYFISLKNAMDQFWKSFNIKSGPQWKDLKSSCFSNFLQFSCSNFKLKQC